MPYHPRFCITNKILKPLIVEAKEIQAAMSRKDKDDEEYETLNRALDTHVKLIQMLTGGKTGEESYEITQIVGMQVINQTQNNILVKDEQEMTQKEEGQEQKTA